MVYQRYRTNDLLLASFQFGQELHVTGQNEAMILHAAAKTEQNLIMSLHGAAVVADPPVQAKNNG